MFTLIRVVLSFAIIVLVLALFGSAILIGIQAYHKGLRTVKGPHAPVIIVDEPQQFLIHDSVQNKSWKAFIYLGQVIIIPGTEVDLND